MFLNPEIIKHKECVYANSQIMPIGLMYKFIETHAFLFP